MSEFKAGEQWRFGLGEGRLKTRILCVDMETAWCRDENGTHHTRTVRDAQSWTKTHEADGSKVKPEPVLNQGRCDIWHDGDDRARINLPEPSHTTIPVHEAMCRKDFVGLKDSNGHLHGVFRSIDTCGIYHSLTPEEWESGEWEPVRAVAVILREGGE